MSDKKKELKEIVLKTILDTRKKEDSIQKLLSSISENEGKINFFVDSIFDEVILPWVAEEPKTHFEAGINTLPDRLEPFFPGLYEIFFKEHSDSFKSFSTKIEAAILLLATSLRMERKVTRVEEKVQSLKK